MSAMAPKVVLILNIPDHLVVVHTPVGIGSNYRRVRCWPMGWEYMQSDEHNNNQFDAHNDKVARIICVVVEGI